MRDEPEVPCRPLQRVASPAEGRNDGPRVPTNVVGIWIQARGVTIDMNGFSLSSSACANLDCSGGGASTGNGIMAASPSSQTPADGITVHGGTIVGMWRGLALSTQSRVYDMTIRSSTGQGILVGESSVVRDVVVEDGNSLGIQAASGTRIENSVVDGNASHGIWIGSGIVSGCTATHNGTNGILAEGSVLRGNTVHSNLVGIDADSSSILVENHVSQNAEDGIVMGGGLAQGNTVTDNLHAGIRFSQPSSSAPASILDNVVTRNGFSGIDLRGGGGRSLVRGNNASLNAGYGLRLDDPNAPDAIYQDNLMHDNGSGTVTGGVNRGGNSCRNLVGAVTDCP